MSIGKYTIKYFKIYYPAYLLCFVSYLLCFVLTDFGYSSDSVTISRLPNNFYAVLLTMIIPGLIMIGRYEEFYGN